jgi:hypothetical protein
MGRNDRLSAAISWLTRLRFLLRPSGQRIHALAFGGAPHAARNPASPSLVLCAGLFVARRRHGTSIPPPLASIPAQQSGAAA